MLLTLLPEPRDGSLGRPVVLGSDPGGPYLGRLVGEYPAATFSPAYAGRIACRLPEIRGRDWADIRPRLELAVREIEGSR